MDKGYFINTKNTKYKSVIEILSDLKARGITLGLEGDRLTYQAPRDAWSDRLANQIESHKAEIVSWLQEREANENIYPLSHGQQGLWLVWQMNPQDPTYNVTLVARLIDDVNIGHLRQAAQMLSDRHKVLRTRYFVLDGVPIQQVNSNYPVAFEVVDGSHWTDQHLSDWIEETGDRPFDLANGYVMRMVVLRHLTRTGKLQFIFHWTIHHIATDFFTQKVLLEELNHIYRCLQQGQQPRLPQVELDYCDFVRWETDVIRYEEDALSGFWSQTLGDTPSVLNLPADRMGSANYGTACGHFNFYVDSQLLAGLRSLARSCQTTLYTVLLSAFHILLARYTGQKRFLINTPTSIRDLPGFERTVGYLVNPVMVQPDLSHNLTFKEFVAQTHQVILEGSKHHLYPYSRVLREMGKALNLTSETRSHSVGFVFDQSRQPMTADALMVETLAFGQRGIEEDLYLLMFDFAGQLSGRFTYRKNLFTSATIERIAGYFQMLLAGIVASPDRSIWNLPLLSEAERHQLLVSWNDNGIEYPRNKCIHQLFEEQVDRQPEAIALVDESAATLTYAELNAHANRLALQLRELGVKQDTLVGICHDRSLELIVGLMGILKSGGAYVPLDPHYPKDRLVFAVKDAGITILLTQRKWVDVIPVTEEMTVLFLEPLTQSQNYDNFTPVTNLDCITSAHNLAYVLYTSGSTGQPKGVAISHRSVTALIAWAKSLYTPEELAGVLASTSIGFDLSVFEIFVTLSLGGTAILIQDALALPSLSVACPPITLINTVPSAMHELVCIGGIPESVRVVNLCGEPLLNSLVQRIYEQPTIQKVYNLYGPSEDTVYSTVYLTIKGATNHPTIGRPLPNTQAYILDDDLQPLPIHVMGELYLAGDKLASGYLNQPEKTASRFILNPFAPGRLYRTGDLARYLPDGNIEFIGRVDHQVKIRGVRVELGEIESLLRVDPGVKEAIVVAHESSSGNPTLVAYVVPLDALETSSLRSYLQAKLSHYMLPAAIVKLDNLPLTPNGKVDRQALPAPDATSFGAQMDFVAPRTPLEETIAQIWCDVLGQKKIGIHDSFNEWGGHSLSATQVISRIRDKLGLQISLRDIFSHFTIAQLAEHIDTYLLLSKVSTNKLCDYEEIGDI
jgi:amino acid adenylation domain-containing protein